VVNSELRRQFDGDVLDAERIQALLQEAEARSVALDRETLAYAFKRHLDKLVDRWRCEPENPEVTLQLAAATELLQVLPFEVNLWRPQNVYFLVKADTFPDVNERAAAGDTAAQLWVAQFCSLGEQLGFRTETAA
jgi:hypothetical protein